ncbi:9078_t:CDS:10 [Acaulospora morrowiae]|uniref:Elongator complex protein 2 n=1 Tax=Acaulospora morrowiae TaxID=94023 RepID=A0A9N9B1M0_9GLOM|nr:9078_t:CDS:10 [Acaulospora morrowiae]
MSVSTEYISIGCNRVPQVASWGKDGLVAFGAHNYVALYYPEDRECKGIVATLSGHKDRVNCVTFIDRGDELHQKNIAMVSGSVDKTAWIWKRSQNGRWVNSAILEPHGGSVNTIGVIQAKSIIVDKDLIVTGSAEGVIKVWERTIIDDIKDSVECIQTIDLGSIYPMTLALSYLPESKVPILAIGCTDKKIFIYIQKDRQFIKSLSLQGHENWIRSLSFATYTSKDDVISAPNSNILQHHRLKDGDLLLASASQDKYVRLWKFSHNGETSKSGNLEEVNVDEVKSNEGSKDIERLSIKELLENIQDNTGSNKKIQLSTKAHIIEVDVLSEGNNENIKKKYSVMFEALLIGHDDWIYSVCWQPPCAIKDDKGNDVYHQPMSILTSSSDKSMIIWKPEPETGIWVNLARMGGIGGYASGFFGGLYGPNGNYALAHGHTGAFHLWKNLNEEENQDWQPQVSISGHFNSVQDLDWDPKFRYLVSVSLDQTARLFAPWNRRINESDGGDEKRPSITTWHEISRPQIHGYDIYCLSFINQWQYVSGADEKILRVFDAPKNFVQSLAKITGQHSILGELESRPVGANLPPLGLSNKAISSSDIEKSLESLQEEDDFLNRQIPAHTSSITLNSLKTFDRPPFEEQLLQNTLWPEIDKLYGHGYELRSVCASHDGKYIACACKATTNEHAIIRMYNTSTWKELSNSSLKSHTLTVTKIRFSHNDKWILAVSRDRFWSLYERTDDKEIPYKLVDKNKAHARIIWDCSWSHDDLLFATASRDKTVKVWRQADNSQNKIQWECISTIKLNEAVTAIDFAPRLIGKSYYVAVGLESGKVFLFKSADDQLERWSLALEVDKDECHVESVNRIILSDSEYIDSGLTEESDERKVKLRLVSCGSDYCVRMLSLEI